MKIAFGVLSLVNQAMCMQMSVHPDGEMNIEGEPDMEMLSEEELVADYFQTFCADDERCGHEVNLNGANPENNNLGGKGPEKAGPQEIRFKEAGKFNCHNVDLVIKTLGDYTPGMEDASGNGAKDGFGYVSLASGTATDVEFTLVDSSSGEPVDVDDFTIYIYDVDMGKRGRGKESMSFCNAAAVVPMAEENNLDIVQTNEGMGCYTVAANKKGTKKDNPTDRNNLSDGAKRRALQVKFTNENRAVIHTAIGAGGDGRAFMFTATAKKLCPTTTTPPPYSTPKPQPVDPDTKCQDGFSGANNCSLDELCKNGVQTEFFKGNIIHNNLGGLGPQFSSPPVIQYTKVAEYKGRSLDFIVSCSDEYKAKNWNIRGGRAGAAYYNGAEPGGAGGIFSMAPMDFHVTFQLVDTETQQPVVVPWWMMTYYDLDGNYESVGTCDAESVATYKDTEMQGPGCSNGCCEMKGARREFKEPPNFDNLAPYYKKDAVTFTFHNKDKAVFHYISTYPHRMWFFKGSKALACDP